MQQARICGGLALIVLAVACGDTVAPEPLVATGAGGDGEDAALADGADSADATPQDAQVADVWSADVVGVWGDAADSAPETTDAAPVDDTPAGDTPADDTSADDAASDAASDAVGLGDATSATATDGAGAADAEGADAPGSDGPDGAACAGLPGCPCAAGVCNDGNPCTGDVCQNGTCLALAVTATCDDGDACTLSDACSQTTCVGTPLGCDDNNVCTDDSCAAVSGCVHKTNSAGCSDGDPCTSGDACVGGGCVATGGNTCACASNADCAPYNDANLCNGALYCDLAKSPHVCKVNPQKVVVCDPSSDTLCHVAVCEPSSGDCVFVVQNSGKACDDGSVCTSGDLCNGANCVAGKALACNDLNGCTVDSCDPVKGCLFAPASYACNDDNACTDSDVCSAGSCAGVVNSCDDGFACTADSCDPLVGCSNVASVGLACAVSGSYAEPFDCGSAALGNWQRSDAVAPASWVRWGFDATPAVPAAQSASCSLNINNGANLACPADQAGIAAAALSPWIDLAALPTGTAMQAGFFSAGNWNASKTAALSVRIDGGAWSEVAVAAPSANWQHITVASGGWAGHSVQFRFQFSGPCEADAFPGWFVDDFGVFEDKCVTQPGACGANAVCVLGPTGQVDCNACSGGFVLLGGSCVDVDECATGTAGCSSSATCSNTVGGYTCTCLGGFTGDGKTCSDVDECKNGTASCSAASTCSNTLGGYTCTCTTTAATCNAPAAPCKTTTTGVDACGKACKKVGPPSCYTVHPACFTSNPGTYTDAATCTTPKGKYDCGLSCQEFPNIIGADCGHCVLLSCKDQNGKDLSQFACNNLPVPPTP